MGNLDFGQVFSAFMVLFAVIDIIGSIPIIVSLRQKNGKIHSLSASITACVIMVLFLFVGEHIIRALGVDVKSFAIAGAMVLFFIALEMILGIEIYKADPNLENSASIFPLAFPLVAGPGSLTTILSLRSDIDTVNIMLAIILNIILVYIILKSSSILEKVIGRAGIGIIKKFFGIILLSISIKLFVQNVKDLFFN